MKRLLLLICALGIVLVGIAAIASYPYWSQSTRFFAYNPCDTPIKYKIGSVDSRFNLTQQQILADTQEATNLWSRLYGKPLFAYASDAALTVNFVYDERTSLYSSISQQKDKLTQENETYKQQVQNYRNDVAAFQNKLASFNATVEKYNKSGGAPEKVYNQLMNENAQLQTEAQSLDARARSLNLTATNFNSQAQSLDQNISQYNAELAVKPEEGLYDPGNYTITIYFVKTQEELEHTLAHEFGHALGFGHVTDPQAIMYPKASETLNPTGQDTLALQSVCKEEPIFSHWLQELENYYSKANSNSVN